jgi:hypothetical protein
MYLLTKYTKEAWMKVIFRDYIDPLPLLTLMTTILCEFYSFGQHENTFVIFPLVSMISY